MLIRVIKNWDQPDLLRQTPQGTGCWGSYRFTLDPVEKCDVVVVLNALHINTEVECGPSNVWALMQEPYIPGIFDWMVSNHGQYERVFTHYPVNPHSPYVVCQPGLPWHVNRTYDELKAERPPSKLADISWITSNLSSFPGHQLRMAFMERLRQSQLNVDIFGRGIRFIGDKWDGLAPYRYALAIENSSSRDYWTEKVADCFLAWTVPIYYGCTNLEDYFPPGAFVRIDINEPDKAIEIISSLMSDDDWRRRLPALNEARQLVLDRYQFFPLMCDLVDRHYENEPTAILALRKYQDSFALIKRVKRRMLRFVENLKP